MFAKICQLSSIHCRILTPEKIIFENTLAESFISTTGALVVLTVSEVSIHPSSQHFIPNPIKPSQRSKHVLIYLGNYVTVQCGRTCGAIDEPSRSSEAIDKRLFIDFRDKNAVNDVFYFYDKMSWYDMIYILWYVMYWMTKITINSYFVLSIAFLFYP